jgi:hypothetical protein
MTHAELVQRAVRWLRNTRRCGVVFAEFRSSSMEIPDAIGWHNGGRVSYLVECKTSVSDFYADKLKPGRTGLMAKAGVGRYRYYMAPPGVLSAELVRKHRPRWGLLEAGPRSVRVLLKAESFCLETAWRELPLLYAYARRIDQYGLTLDEAQRACDRYREEHRLPGSTLEMLPPSVAPGGSR